MSAGRAVIYARYSSAAQRDASIEDQVRVCRECAERRGDRIVEVYADRATSGTTTAKRDEFMRLMADSRDGRWDTLYVYKIDRFARNRYDSAIYRKELSERGVSIVAAAESIPDGPDGIILEALLEGLAEYYSANLSENVKRGMEGNALKCMHNGARCYGYDLGSDGYYHVNEAEAEVVRTVFGLYAGGASCPEIVEALSPYRTRTGKRWRVQDVSRMVRNEKYAGTYVYKDHRVPGGMEAIVDMATFDAAQARTENRRRSRRRLGAVDYTLTGMLFDGEGRPFVGVSGRGRRGKKYCYYKCLETGTAWPKDKVDEAVAEALSSLFDAGGGAMESIADMVMSALDEEQTEERRSVEEAERRVASMGREVERLIDLAMKVDENEQVAARIDAVSRERAELEDDLARRREALDFISRDKILFFLEEVRRTGKPAKVVEAFVSRVMIDVDGAVTVEFGIGENDSVGKGKINEPPGRPGGSNDSLRAGAEGFEPPTNGTKNRCPTIGRRPSVREQCSRLRAA